MTRIVIVGAGIAGVPAAYLIKAKLGGQASVTVISDKDYFHFVPSNPWIAMGGRKCNDTAFPIEPYLTERGIAFIAKALRKIHAGKNQVELADGSMREYDFLILATGPEPAFDEIEGLDPEQGRTHCVTHIKYAVKTHADYLQFVHNPGPIVIGAMQNSSILGPMYEFAFLVDADLRRRNIRDRVPITLVTPEPYVGHLGLGAESETRRLLETALADREISYVCNTKTIQIEPGKIHIMECDDRGNDLQAGRLPFAYSVYWPAFRGVQALRSCAGLTDERGFVTVDEYLRSPAHPNIFAVGVCASHPALGESPIPIGAPDSVYSIQNEVYTAVQNILASIKREALSSAVPQRAKWLSDMGESGASYLSEPQIPLRNINWLKQGRWVHLAKVDFENYFINKIKLKPAATSPSASSHVATVISRMQSAKKEKKARQYVKRYATKPIVVRLPRDIYYELSAMETALSLEANTLAAELLDAAIRDAKLYMDDATLSEIERVYRDLLLADLPENQQGVEFHGGST